MTTTSEDVSRAYMEDVKVQRTHPGQLLGYSWGYSWLDRKTKGLRKGVLAMVGADTGVGKSLFLGDIVRKLAQECVEEGLGKVIRVVHAEMTLKEFQARMISAMTGIPKERIDDGLISEEEYGRVSRAAMALAKLPIEYLESPTSIEETINFITKDDRCAVFCIDHMQAHDIGRGNLSPLDFQGAAALAKEFYTIARNVCPGIVLTQLSNDVAKREDHRPNKGDIYGGKMMQAFASLILLLYVPTQYEQRSESEQNEPETMWVILDKNRHGGIGQKKFTRFPDTLRMEEAA